MRNCIVFTAAVVFFFLFSLADFSAQAENRWTPGQGKVSPWPQRSSEPKQSKPSGNYRQPARTMKRVPAGSKRNWVERSKLPVPGHMVQEMREIVRTAAKKFGANYHQMSKVIARESSWNPMAYNPRDPNGGSLGLLQFQIPTFRKFAPLAGVRNPDIWNPEHQATTAAYMFKNGHICHWTTARWLGYCR